MRRKKSNHLPHDAEVNIVPIIDCLIILISFLLLSGMGSAVGIFDLRVSANQPDKPTEATSSAPKNDSEWVEVEIRSTKSLALTYHKGSQTKRLKAIDPLNQEINLDQLTLDLKSTLDQHSNVEKVSIIGHKTTKYKDVISTMDVAKRIHPSVTLGGF